MKIKQWVCVICVVVLSFALASCGGGAGAGATISSAFEMVTTTEPVSITELPATTEQTEPPETTAPGAFKNPDDPIPYAAIIEAYREYNRFIDTNKNNEDYDLEFAMQILYDRVYDTTNIDECKKYYEWLDYNLSCSIIESRGLGYAIHDINGDGVDELFIISGNYYESGIFIHAIFTHDGENPMLVDAFWTRHSCVIDENGIIYNYGSAGAWNNYRASYYLAPNSASLVMIEMVGIEDYDEEKLEYMPEPWYFLYQRRN